MALDDRQVGALLDARDAAGVLSAASSLWEAARPRDRADCGPSWDALHRCLTDGSLEPDAGQYPLNRCVLGGQDLVRGDGARTRKAQAALAALVMPGEVQDVARALAQIEQDWLHERFFTIAPQGYAAREQPPAVERAAFAATWEAFESVRAFYARAAKGGRAALFTLGR